MERLTEWLNEETKTEVSITHYKMRDAMVRLAKYEDTGLTPEQVRELQEKQDKAIERLEDFQNIVGYDLLTVQACIRIVREAV